MDKLKALLVAAASSLPSLSSLSDENLLTTLHSSVLEVRKITSTTASRKSKSLDG